MSGFLVFRMGLVGGGATFTGLGCPLSRHASGASMLGLGGFVELN